MHFDFVKNLNHFGWMVKFGQKIYIKIKPEDKVRDKKNKKNIKISTIKLEQRM